MQVCIPIKGASLAPKLLSLCSSSYVCDSLSSAFPGNGEVVQSVLHWFLWDYWASPYIFCLSIQPLLELCLRTGPMLSTTDTKSMKQSLSCSYATNAILSWIGFYARLVQENFLFAWIESFQYHVSGDLHPLLTLLIFKIRQDLSRV